MIILDSTVRTLEVKLGGLVTTSQLTVVANYVDMVQATVTLLGAFSSNVLTNGTTPVTALTAPAAGNSRHLKFLSVENTDTVPQTVTIQYNDNGTIRPIVVQALTAGQTLQYADGVGFSIAFLSSGGGSSLPDPVTVPHGGTGQVTLTAHGVVIGEGAGAVAATSAGTATQVLTSNGASADPTFQAVPSDATKAPLASPTFTGVPAAPTAAAGTSTTQLATTAFVRTNYATGTTSSATPTPDIQAARNFYDLTAQAAAAAFANPTGAPQNFDALIIRIKDNGTARALTWGSAYVAGGVALPTTTILSKILTLGFIYNTANALNKWQCVASAQEA